MVGAQDSTGLLVPFRKDEQLHYMVFRDFVVPKVSLFRFPRVDLKASDATNGKSVSLSVGIMAAVLQ